MGIALLFIFPIVSDAPHSVELAPRQGRRAADDANVGAIKDRSDCIAIVIDVDIEALKIFMAEHVVLESQRNNLTRIRNRAPANSNDEVSVDVPGRSHGLQHVCTRSMGSNAVIGHRQSGTQSRLNSSDFICVVAKGAADQQKNPFGVQALGLFCQGVRGGAAHVNPFGCR